MSVVVSDTSPLHYLILCDAAVTGTIGALETAAARGLIQLEETIARLQQTNARIDPALIRLAIERQRNRQE